MSGMERLADQVHIWTLPLDRVARQLEAPADDPLIDQLETVLSNEEKARSRRFAFENSRREYVAAHALCRVMLSTFSDVRPRDWRFDAGPQGRPEIAEGSNAGGVRFNISHTRGLVCVAVTRTDDIGVDVEWMGRGNNIDDIAKAKFSKPEIAHLKQLPESEKRHCFFSFWTLKEAYIKAIGKGLAEPLDGFAFAFDPLRIDFLRDQDDPRDWRFQSSRPAPDYLCAVAVRLGAGRELNVVHRAFDHQGLFNLVSAARP